MAANSNVLLSVPSPPQRLLVHVAMYKVPPDSREAPEIQLISNLRIPNMKVSANTVLHPFLQTAAVRRGSGQTLHTRQCHKGPLLHLQILGLLFWFCGMIWINLTPLFSLTPPRSSSQSISSRQSKSAINQSPMSSCCLCLRKCSPSDHHWMLYCINAASLCQHLTFHKETAHTKSSWSVLSQP